ncbi:hypothetical protein MRB53_022270 [Persea americana]|uniref:Uncharacterized protein n=1 Tax=Persea americana TaxID=3435 RepID=A0ACC2L656_PERAE|nr:hypothetical protein MRB53_022270 [Persea americana]
MAKISAQETLFWQFGLLSTAPLALITVSNPSPASHASRPCNMERLTTTKANKERQCYGLKEIGQTRTKQPWKNLSIAGAFTNAYWNLFVTTPRTMDSTLGHVLL